MEKTRGHLDFFCFFARPNHTLEDASAFVPASAFRRFSSFSAADFNMHGLQVLVVFGLTEEGCLPPAVLLGSVEPVLSSSSPSPPPSASSSGDDDNMAAIIGAAVGGGAALLLASALLACSCFVAVCTLCLILVVVVVVVGVAAVVVVLVVVAGGVGVAGAGGGGAAVALKMRGGGSPEWYEEPAEDLDEVQARMQATREYRLVAFDEIKLGRKIGEGAYGAVFVGEWEGVKVAVKVITGALTVQSLREFEHEALMMAKVSHHPNVVQFIGASVETERLAMVLRFCDGGSLDKALEAGALDAAAKTRVLSEVAGALAFLHSIGVVQRDVAARKVLLDRSMTAKLADLGLSRLLEDGADEQSTKSMIGPVRGMAPEALTEQRYSAASDAWSIGVLLWEVWSDGATPYSGFASLAEVATAVVREGGRLQAPSGCPLSHTSLLSRLFSTDPHDRPSMDEAFEVLHSQPEDSSNSPDGSTYEYASVDMP